MKYKWPMQLSKKSSWSIFVILSAILVCSVLEAGPPASKSPAPEKVVTSFNQPTFNGSEKLDLNLKRLWGDAMRSGNMDVATGCTVKLNGAAGKKTVARLKEAGLQVRTVLKTVVTGKIEFGNLPFLVAMDEVRSVEGGKRLGLK